MKITICIAFFLSTTFICNAGSIHVGIGQAYTSIQKALNAAMNGDTIFVHAGIFREGNIIISKAVCLIGLDTPVLDGENKFEILSVKSDAVLVEGFKIINSGISSIEELAGIKMYNCRDVTIRNNILINTFFGIYVQYSKHCTIEKNSLSAFSLEEQQSGNGIHCWKSDSLLIIANTIIGHRDGIYFEFVTHSVIWRNIVEKNMRYGLHFMFSNNDEYYCNVFRNNGAGVAVMFSKQVKMVYNYFEENWGDGAYGLLLKEISDSYMDNNRFVRNTTGIFMEGVSRLQMLHNVFESNGWALKIQASCMDVTVNRNNFKNNTFDVATNGSLVLNDFNGNFWDKYEGYDLDKDRVGDIPYRPVSLYAMIIEQNPPAILLFRSFMTSLLDKTEKILPSITPLNLKDDKPLMKALPI